MCANPKSLSSHKSFTINVINNSKLGDGSYLVKTPGDVVKSVSYLLSWMFQKKSNTVWLSLTKCLMSKFLVIVVVLSTKLETLFQVQLSNWKFSSSRTQQKLRF